MALHFSRTEYATRLGAARRAIRDKRLDALLIFSQESHYYLTGYDTSGYVWFQCGILTPDDSPYTLMIRMPDVQNARITSVVEDIRVWDDDGITNPAMKLKRILGEKSLKGGRIGIELATHGLTGANFEKVRTALDGWCRLEDATMLVRLLRVVKSPEELFYVRRAAEIADEAMIAMTQETRPNAFEGDIAAGVERGAGTPLKLGLVVEGVDVREATGAEDLDHSGGRGRRPGWLRLEMRCVGRVCRLFLCEQGCQGHTTEAATELPERIAA